MTTSPKLFTCYGIGYSHSTPDHLYPLTRCFGYRGRTEVDYGKYYNNLNNVHNKSEKSYIDQRIPNDSSSFPFEIKAISTAIGPALTPSLSPNVPLLPEVSPNPKFPRPVPQSQRREDICLGPWKDAKNNQIF